MRLEKLIISNFRNHWNLEFEPGRSITNIYGRNGSGKTNILEAVHYCAMTRGFSGSCDDDCIMFEKECFSIRSSFKNGKEKETKVNISYNKKKEKNIFVNDFELTKYSTHIGHIPCVTFTPKEMVIITGSPAERRRFVDTAICQHNKKYLSDLLQYKRVLMQRNALLAGIKEFYTKDTALDVLTEQLILFATEVIYERENFIEKFFPLLEKVYKYIQEGIKPIIKYQSTTGTEKQKSTKEEIKSFLIKKYCEQRTQEIYRGQTIAGPHRDDILFFINQKDIKKYASQGQQRAFLIGLKIAMISYLFDKSEEMPISLLDDIFSELDENVTEKMIENLSKKGQVIITSTKKIYGKDVKNINI